FRDNPEVHNGADSTVPVALLAPRRLPLLSSPWLARNWQRLALPPGPRSRLRRAGVKQCDLLYVDSPLFAFLADEVPHRRLVYRMADVLTAFPGVSPALAELESDLVRRAHVAVASSAALVERAQRLGARRSVLLPNGVETERFRIPRPPPPEYAWIPTPRAVFVGSLGEWFDHQSVTALARARPDLSVVIIGAGPALSKLPRLPNLFLLGSRVPDDVPAFLQHAAVGLIPFAVERHRELIEAAHPVKLFEYLAAGLPVAAARWRTLVELSAPATILAEPGDFTAAVAQALACKPDTERVASFLAGRSWAARATDLLAACALPA
ncbi:MAG: glycosyltransferase, partial [Planctomycetota bacterium]